MFFSLIRSMDRLWYVKTNAAYLSEILLTLLSQREQWIPSKELMWSDGKEDLNKVETGVEQQLAAVMLFRKKNQRAKRVWMRNWRWCSRLNVLKSLYSCVLANVSLMGLSWSDEPDVSFIGYCGPDYSDFSVLILKYVWGDQEGVDPGWHWVRGLIRCRQMHSSSHVQEWKKQLAKTKYISSESSCF